MKVLIADQFSEEGIKELERSGMVVHYDSALSGETLTKTLSEK